MSAEMVIIRCNQGPHEFMAYKVMPETGIVIQQFRCPRCGAEWEQFVPNAVEMKSRSC